MHRIRVVKSLKLWRVVVLNRDGSVSNLYFPFAEGALRMAGQINDRYVREEKATLLVSAINPVFLNIKEHMFYYKMRSNNCTGITKRQYGYLKGLAERNPLGYKGA